VFGVGIVDSDVLWTEAHYCSALADLEGQNWHMPTKLMQFSVKSGFWNWASKIPRNCPKLISGTISRVFCFIWFHSLTYICWNFKCTYLLQSLAEVVQVSDDIIVMSLNSLSKWLSGLTTTVRPQCLLDWFADVLRWSGFSSRSGRVFSAHLA